MKVYVGEDYEVYTEKDIDEEITQKIKAYNYEGLLDYIANNFTETEIFAMLSPDIQSAAFEYLKKEILDNEFCIQYIDEPLPCDRCPFTK